MKIYVTTYLRFTILALLMLCVMPMRSHAETSMCAPLHEESDSVGVGEETDTLALTAQTEKRGVWKKLCDYFRNSNKQSTNKKIDFGFIPGPNYSSTTGLGLGLLGTATYSADRSDSTLARSNAAVYSNMTTGGFFLVGLRGNHIFPTTVTASTTS